MCKYELYGFKKDNKQWELANSIIVQKWLTLEEWEKILNETYYNQYSAIHIYHNNELLYIAEE